MKAARWFALLAALLLSLTARAEATPGDAPEVGLIPRYVLMDPNGRAVSGDDFPGRFQLIAFGYTYCPDVCPTTLAEMALVLKRLGDDAKRVQGIFISVDPERDTPAKLKEYTAFFDPRILGLTGSPDLVHSAAEHFKVTYKKVKDPDASQYSVDHTAGMYLLGPDGGFLVKFAYGLPAEDVVARIREYVKR